MSAGYMRNIINMLTEDRHNNLTSYDTSFTYQGEKVNFRVVTSVVDSYPDQEELIQYVQEVLKQKPNRIMILLNKKDNVDWNYIKRKLDHILKSLGYKSHPLWDDDKVNLSRTLTGLAYVLPGYEINVQDFRSKTIQFLKTWGSGSTRALTFLDGGVKSDLHKTLLEPRYHLYRGWKFHEEEDLLNMFDLAALPSPGDTISLYAKTPLS